MRIKNFTLMLMAVLFSVAGFAQRPFTSRNNLAINRQTTIQKLVKQNSIKSAIAVNQSGTPSRSAKVSAKAPAKAPELVTPPEKGFLEYYTLTGTNSRGGKMSRQVQVVWDDMDEDIVYISGFSYFFPKSFVMGTFNKEGDQVTFKAAQYMGDVNTEDGPAPVYFGGYGNGSSLVDVVAAFDEKTSTFTFSDYLLDNGDTREIGFYAYWQPGVSVAPLQGEPEIPVQIPKDLEIETYAFTANDYWNGPVSGNLSLGIYGKIGEGDVYIQGMSKDAPEAWIRGKFTDATTVTFNSGQLLDDGIYFNVLDANFDFTDEYVLVYDPATGSFTEDGGWSVISDLKNDATSGLYQFYQNYVIKPITEKAATPAMSSISSINFKQQGDVLELNVAKVDVDDEGMVADKIFYILYSQDENGDPVAVTLSKDDYASLEKDMTEVPATFTDGTDFLDGSLKLNMDGHSSWQVIGIQTVYYGGEERNVSDISWYTPTWPQTITLPEGLTVTEHTFEGDTYSDGNSIPFERRVGLAFDGDDMYIRGLGTENANVWVKGTKNGEGAYIFPKGQDLGNFSSSYRLFLVGYPNNEASDVVLTVDAARGVYEFADIFLENAAYTDRSYYLTRFNGGATINMTEAGEEVLAPVTAPEGLQTEVWSFSATNYFDSQDAGEPVLMARNVNVGFDEDDVYIQGLSSSLPNAWVKGTIDEDGQIVFRTGQYMGNDGSRDLWFIAYDDNSGLSNYVLDYDTEAEVMSNLTETQYMGTTYAKNKPNNLNGDDFCYGVTIKKLVEKAATPATPSISHINFSVYGPIAEFSIPTVDVDGDGLIADKLSYKLYYDEGDGEAKEITFTTDLYEKLTEDMTVVPFGFLDDVDDDGNPQGFDFGLGQVYLNMLIDDEAQTWARIGIQSIYTGGDETNASEIGWYTPVWPTIVELPEGAEIATYAFSGTVKDLDENDNEINVPFSKAVNVAFVDNDIYLQGVGEADEEVWIKGTKQEGETVYTFTKGQDMGIYYNPRTGRASNRLFLLGYNGLLGETEAKLTYDEESGVFKTITDFLENANYTDKRYYLTYINSGAVIKPVDMNRAATPATPSVDDIAYTVYGDVALFTIPTADVDGLPLDEAKLSYKLYYDEGDGEAKEVVFTTDDYECLTEDMTVIPYGFLDDEDEEGNPVGYDFYADHVYLNMVHNTWTRIGIQAIYTGGDETNASEIGWYEVIMPQIVSLPDGAEALDYEFQGTNYDTRAGYVIGGVKVAFVEDDIYIQGISTVNSEAWIKGTKDENGNYVFALGQFLGQTQNSSGNDVFAFLAGFDDSVGRLTEFMMSYDEETGIFTTLTYMIENSNFVDAMNYLSAFLSGAKLLPASHPDAIDTVEAADDEKAATFNIAGQRVGKNYKGIVVKAGRKVLQK